jgi:hypothetical protein
MLFAHLKRILKLDRLRLRGPNGAKDEFHLAAAAQNLRKLAKLIPTQPVTAPKRRPAMEYYAGLDVSLEKTHLCVLDRDSPAWSGGQGDVKVGLGDLPPADFPR